MAMQYHFLRTKYDEDDQWEAMEKAVNENAATHGFILHSWHPTSKGIAVLMVRPEPQAAPAPMAMTGQRQKI
jgi:hypothetical protein